MTLWQEFEFAPARILGAPLDAAVHGLQTLPRARSSGCRAWMQ
jgi:hypothetical protein